MDYSKICTNKDYTYLPYLWIIRLKTEGMYLSLVHTLFRSKARKIRALHPVRNVADFVIVKGPCEVY